MEIKEVKTTTITTKFVLEGKEIKTVDECLMSRGDLATVYKPEYLSFLQSAASKKSGNKHWEQVRDQIVKMLTEGRHFSDLLLFHWGKIGVKLFFIEEVVEIKKEKVEYNTKIIPLSREEKKELKEDDWSEYKTVLDGIKTIPVVPDGCHGYRIIKKAKIVHFTNEEEARVPYDEIAYYRILEK